MSLDIIVNDADGSTIGLGMAMPFDGISYYHYFVKPKADPDATANTLAYAQRNFADPGAPLGVSGSPVINDHYVGLRGVTSGYWFTTGQEETETMTLMWAATFEPGGVNNPQIISNWHISGGVYLGGVSIEFITAGTGTGKVRAHFGLNVSGTNTDQTLDLVSPSTFADLEVGALTLRDNGDGTTTARLWNLTAGTDTGEQTYAHSRMLDTSGTAVDLRIGSSNNGTAHYGQLRATFALIAPDVYASEGDLTAGHNQAVSYLARRGVTE